MDDPHLIANYWKRLLREMMDPLITFEQYTKFRELKWCASEDYLDKI